MDTMDKLVDAKTICTKGLMTGNWKRITSEKGPPQIFQSESHSNYSLKFTNAWLVEVTNEEESYGYFWDPTKGDLTAIGMPEKDHTLAVELVEVEAHKDENDKRGALIRENEKLLAKVDDLQKQVYSLQFICSREQETSQTLLEKLKEHTGKKKKKDDNAAAISQLQFKHNAGNVGKSKRPPKPSQLLAQYDPSNIPWRSVPPYPFCPAGLHAGDPSLLSHSYPFGSFPGGGQGFYGCNPNWNYQMALNQRMTYQYPRYDQRPGNPWFATPHPAFQAVALPRFSDPRSRPPPPKVDQHMPVTKGSSADQHWVSNLPLVEKSEFKSVNNRPVASASTFENKHGTDINVMQMDQNSHEESKMEQPPIRERIGDNKLSSIDQPPVHLEEENAHKITQPRENSPKPKAIIPRLRPDNMKYQSNESRGYNTAITMVPNDHAGNNYPRKFRDGTAPYIFRD